MKMLSQIETKHKIGMILLILIITVSAIANNGPLFLELSSDKSSYSVGEKAILSANIVIQPDDPTYEIYLKAKFDNKKIKLTRLTEHRAVALTPSFDDLGNYVWQVKVYLQKKRPAANLNESIAYYQSVITQCEGRLEYETDPDIISTLKDAIANAKTLIRQMERDLEDLRILVGVQTLTVAVESKQTVTNNNVSPAFYIETDRDNDTFAVGERATLF